MSKSEHDDGWRPEIVDDDSAPLPEPWFLRDLRSRNAQAGAVSPGAERRTLPSEPSLNLGRRYDDAPMQADSVPFWRRWWPLAAGGATVFVVLILILFVPPRVDGASTPIDVAPETLPTVAAAQAPAPAALPTAVETADASDVAPADPSQDPAPVTVADSNPSFDCDSVASHVNRTICASPELGALDRQLAARYIEIADGLDPDDRAELEDSRAAFLRRKMRCDDETCIARTYDDRLAELNEFADNVDSR